MNVLSVVCVLICGILGLGFTVYMAYLMIKYWREGKLYW